MLGDYPVRIWHASQSKSCVRCHHDDHKHESKQINVLLTSKNKMTWNLSDTPIMCYQFIFHVKLPLINRNLIVLNTVINGSNVLSLWSLNLQNRVFKAPSAALAKQISSQMPVDKILTDWNNKKLDVMVKVLRAKLECCSLYRDVLLKSDTIVLVECTKDEYRGANMPHYLVKTTHPQYYSGQNRLGKLHMEIRQNLQSVSQQDLPNPANPPPSLQPGSKTAGLVSSAPVIWGSILLHRQGTHNQWCLLVSHHPRLQQNHHLQL